MIINTPKYKTVYEHWQIFNEALIPVGTAQETRDKLREAFYMGACAFEDLRIGAVILKSQDLSESIALELHNFIEYQQFGPQKDQTDV